MCSEKNVWKVGSNWGNNEESILHLFLNYGCVFFGGASDNAKKGDWRKVKKGDLLIITEGETSIAIGECLSSFSSYEESKIHFCSNDRKYINENDVVICKANLFLLPEKNRFLAKYGNDTQEHFCRHANAAPVIESWMELKNESSKNSFKLDCKTEDLSKLFSGEVRYHVPIYQRPYSWGNGELRSLIENLADAFKKQEPVFMGTIQFSAPVLLDPDGKKRSYDIIDGQQRLTTFLILQCVLDALTGNDSNEKFKTILYTHVNRGSAQEDLDEFFSDLKSVKDIERLGEKTHNKYSQNAKELYRLIKEFFSNKDKYDSIPKDTLKELSNFITENIQFIVIETHANLSKTLKIFDTINTTGLDLGTSDLFKIRFYEYRTNICGDRDDIFDEISEIYQTIDKLKREHPLELEFFLSTYQRILIAKHKLGYELYSMSYSLFFERLFDTALKIRAHKGFENFTTANNPLTLDELKKLCDCYTIVCDSLAKDKTYNIFYQFIWLTTRYGRQAHDYAIIALFFNQIKPQQLQNFMEALFKMLIPVSLYWSKQVLEVLRKLHQILWNMGDSSHPDIIATINEWTQEQQNRFESACKQEIAFNSKWKNLVCRLCEYLQNPKISSAQLFDQGIDIEHIQCFTDQEDPEKIKNEWKEELNRLGNLVLLESSLNRSINNKHNKKEECYRQSVYKTVQALADCVSSWNKEAAENRRRELTDKMAAYIFSTGTGH
ncbi:DUF262 domain-containing HNH endonuclease family protein [uncultured Akkermansia sp.]|uniref:DUF262 domain-containing protein n=1 Tax=uncultured Akkermansia sp. TaxID=512294 RepID=UPI0025FBB5D0|nr:DUF262 domain-containing HNH endonuclease family protein [uncultured Akkermansia sp.]